MSSISAALCLVRNKWRARLKRKEVRDVRHSWAVSWFDILSRNRKARGEGNSEYTWCTFVHDVWSHL